MARLLINPTDVRQRMADKGLNQSMLAKAVGLTDKKISELFNGKRRLKTEEAAAIARHLGLPIRTVFENFGITYSDPYSNLVRVSGYVGAGGEVSFIDDIDTGFGIDEIEVPFIGYEGIVLQVCGDSMAPRYRDGEYIAYSENRAPEDALHREAVVETTEGQVLLKRVHRGGQPSTFTLTSLNPEVPPMSDVSLHWAAFIDWHKPR